MRVLSVRQAEAAGPPGPEEARLRHVAEEFEGILLAQMLKAMRGRTGEKGFLGMGHGEKIMRELFDEELGRALARSGGIGLARLLSGALASRIQPGEPRRSTDGT